MEGYLLVFIIFLIIILIIGVPFLASFLIYKFLSKRNINKKYRILAFLPIFIVGYYIYIAFYPLEEFYREDFKEVTNISLPINSKFCFKTASYPDLQGDYTFVSIIEVDSNFYKKLKKDLIKIGFSRNSLIIGHKEKDKALAKLKDRKIETDFSKQINSLYYYVAFLSDKKTILVQRSSH